MLMKPECVTCILNQIIRIIDHGSITGEEKDKIFRIALEKASELDHSVFLPPLYSEILYDSLAELTGEKDPYRDIRKIHNDLILDRISLFEKLIGGSPDPLFTSLLYSLLGNIIDLGGVEIFDFEHLFEDNRGVKIEVNQYKTFRKKAVEAGSLLIIADNAGESVFDMMFMRQLKSINPEIKIFYGVKSGPAINDVLKEDAEYIGIGELAEIIETGSTYAGTVISESLPEFRDIFRKSDIVISKGQGNFETLESVDERDIFFVFKVKCKVVSEFTGLKEGSLVMGFGDFLK